MTLRVVCQRCRHTFDVTSSQRGGLVNCPACRQVVPAPGGPEPLFWFLVALGVGVVLLIGGIFWAAVGPLIGGVILLVGLVLVGLAILSG